MLLCIMYWVVGDADLMDRECVDQTLSLEELILSIAKSRDKTAFERLFHVSSAMLKGYAIHCGAQSFEA